MASEARVHSISFPGNRGVRSGKSGGRCHSFVNLLFIPSAVVGGTLLFLELESPRPRPADGPRPSEN